MDIYLITLEILFYLPGEYKKDELLESARYVVFMDTSGTWLLFYNSLKVFCVVNIYIYELTFRLGSKLWLFLLIKLQK